MPCRSSQATAMLAKESLLPRRFYRQRKIENFFCRVKDLRRIATRDDKLARNFRAHLDDAVS